MKSQHKDGGREQGAGPKHHSHPPRSDHSRRKHQPRHTNRILPLLQMDCEDVVYTCFDLETTGGNPERNAITEICALKVHKGEVKDSFYTLVNPKMPIPPIVRRMTGIDNAMVRNAPLIQDVMPGFMEFVKDTVLVSHNTIGDMKFLRHFSAKVSGQPIDNFFLCTHLLAEKLCKQAPNKSLKGLGQYFGFVAKGKMHRADTDAYMTMDLFLELKRRFNQQKVQLLSDAIRFQGDYESGLRLGWAVNQPELEDLSQQPGLIFLYNRFGKLHFVTSALNLRREVRRLTKYNQLPKPLLRLVLNTYRVETKPLTSHFHAMLDESKWLSQHRTLLHPSQWHQRSVQMVNVFDAGARVEIAMGDLMEGAVAAFGPVGDRKETGKFLARVIETCHGVCDKKMSAERRYRGLLLEYFSGQMAHYEQNLKDRLASVVWRWFTGRAQSSRQILTAAEKLARVRLPTPWHSFLEKDGLLLIKEGQSDKYAVFRFRYGRLYAGGHYAGSPDAIHEKPNFIARQIRLIKGKKGRHRPLTNAEALHANAVIWWIGSHHRSEGRFYPLTELTALGAKTR